MIRFIDKLRRAAARPTGAGYRPNFLLRAGLRRDSTPLRQWPGLFCIGLLCALALPAQAERRDREQPIQLDAGRVLLDEAKQESVFEGQVRLTQGTLLIEAERIATHEDGEGFQRIVASGNPALFRQRYEGSDEYAEGRAARIEYDTRLEQVDFYGNARIRRGRDEVQGGHIRYNTRTEVFEAVGNADRSTGSDGRVRAVIRPKAAASGRPESTTPAPQQPGPQQP